MASETEQREHVRDLLRSSEELVRAYDLKSEIAMLCFVLSIEAMNVIIDLHAIAMRRPLLAGLLFIAFLAAMVGYLGVVAPIFRRMPARANDYSAVNVFFIADPRNVSPEVFLRTLAKTDFLAESARQIMLYAELRNIKHWRFNFGLAASFAFYALAVLGWLAGR